MANEHPEVQAEIQEIEEALAIFSQGFQKEPSRNLLGGIMTLIEEDEESDKTPVIPLTQDPVKSDSDSFNWRWIAVAAGVALLVSLFLNFYQYSQWQNAETQIAQLTQQQSQMAEDLQRASDKLNIFDNPNQKLVALKGLDIAPEFSARVLWDNKSDQVYLVADEMNLPDPNKQFQLWAIVDGKPVSAGVFNVEEGIQKLAIISGNVSAFAVTLEPKGGSEGPTLDQMYLLGEVS